MNKIEKKDSPTVKFAFSVPHLINSPVTSLCEFSSSDWADVVVTRPSVPTTLLCTDTEVKGSVTINWMVQSPGADNWKLVLSANDRTGFSGGSSKASMRLADPNFRDTGVFSLFLLPETEDSGLYSCRIKRQMRGLEERIILLAILTGSEISSTE